MKRLASVFALSVVFFACSPNEEVQAIEKTKNNDIVIARASFDVVTNHGLVNESETLVLNNTSKNAVSYHWDFGNGETSTAKQPDFKFPMHGFYDITLTVTDSEGNQNRYTKEVGVLCNFAGDH